MSPRKRTQEPRTSPIKLEIYQESGETYRPFKSVARIKAIDRKKKSKIDPRLMIKGVGHEYLSVWDASEESPSGSSSPSPTRTIQNTSTPTVSPSSHLQTQFFTSPEDFTPTLFQPSAYRPVSSNTVASHVEIPYLKKEEETVDNSFPFIDGHQLALNEIDQCEFVGSSSGLSYGYDLQSQFHPSDMPLYLPCANNYLDDPHASEIVDPSPLLGATISGYDEFDLYNNSSSDLDSQSSSSCATSPPLSPSASSCLEPWSFSSSFASTPSEYYDGEDYPGTYIDPTLSLRSTELQYDCNSELYHPDNGMGLAGEWVAVEVSPITVY
ncbi:hypothetical protein SCHPADRAFT_226159 [Schizopora paradoxa]|uniref:Uncharacterized protein n=1 Tax=Schizopora paradoxa TaxID=27342 RepID=A0A0H2SGL7_9AGAM|nr:hypothetical protein SCHPADRAFT_226159 [Schizopora paradoxa]